MKQLKLQQFSNHRTIQLAAYSHLTTTWSTSSELSIRTKSQSAVSYQQAVWFGSVDASCYGEIMVWKLKTSITSLRRWFGPRKIRFTTSWWNLTIFSLFRSFWQVFRWKRSYGSKVMAVWSFEVKSQLWSNHKKLNRNKQISGEQIATQANLWIANL